MRIFLAARGNIKEVERMLGISYPTVKSRLEGINRRLGNEVSQTDAGEASLSVLDSLENGEISVEDAIKLLKKK